MSHSFFRAYHPAFGRWISRDPIEEEGGLNQYAYVRNSSINLTDPSGLLDIPFPTSPQGVVLAGTIIITAYVIQNGIPVITPGEVRLPPFGDFINCMAKPKPGSKPKKGVPPGTIPINQSGLPHETIERIKKQIGAAPTDWVGISPEGDVISGDAEGNAVNQGPKESY